MPVISGFDSRAFMRLKYSIIFYNLYLCHKDIHCRKLDHCAFYRYHGSTSVQQESSSEALYFLRATLRLQLRARASRRIHSFTSLTILHAPSRQRQTLVVIIVVATSIPSSRIFRFRSDRNCKIIWPQILETTAAGYRKEPVSERNWLSGNATYIRAEG